MSMSLFLIVIAYVYLASVSIVLTLIDVRSHRLPNAIVLPSYAVLAMLFTGACLFGAPWQNLLRAAIGAATLFGFYWLLRAIRPGGMGGGDVKLAGVLGLYLGWLGWGPVIVGGFLGFLLGAVVGIGILLTRKGGRKTAIPFGPFMLAGALLAVLWGESLADLYTGVVFG